jgi:hypothetical protein
LEKRLRERYVKLVRSHSASSNALASGPQAVPGVNQAFATTQAAYRFFHNPRISLRALAAPLIAFSRQEAARVCQRYVLVAHDWTPLSYLKHTGKKDRVMFSQCRKPEGYEVQSALALSDHDGSPLAPLVVSLRAVDGVHCSRSSQVREALSPLDELDPAMTYIEHLKLPLPVVHLVDAEADSVAHFREWSLRPGRWFLVRGDDRLVEYQGREQRCSAIQSQLRDAGRFTVSCEVLYHGKPAQQHVAEVPVRLLRAGQRNRPNAGDRQRIVGSPLALRLIIAEVRSLEGESLATWYLLAHLPPEVNTETVAQWYYWRWKIEEFFKLLKSAGVQAEQWQQESADAVTRRLLVAAMACVVVWHLARSEHPDAPAARKLLVRLSGRQLRRGREFTTPAMLAGMWNLLAILEELNRTPLEELQSLAKLILAQPP